MAAAVTCRPVFADVTNFNGNDVTSTRSVDMNSSTGRGLGARKGVASSSRSVCGLGKDFAPPRRAPLQAVPVGCTSGSIFEDTHTTSTDEYAPSGNSAHGKQRAMRYNQVRSSSRGNKGKPRDAHHAPLKSLARECEGASVLGDELDASVKGRNRSKISCQAFADAMQRSGPTTGTHKEPSRTQLASLFDAFRYSPVLEERVEAVLADLADEVLQTSHRESQRYLPKTEDLLARLGNGQREPILDWLVQACDIMRLPDAIVYSTVLTLDRYCAACKEPVAMESMQKVLMAVICTVLKTCAVSDEVCMPLRDLLLHLCRGQVHFEDILLMEHRVLQTLQYKGLFAPTALEFLEALKTPLTHCFGEAVDAADAFDLANFLMQLSFFNASLHYGYPHSVLAASALYVALCHLQCSPVVVQNLFTNISAICSDKPDVATLVLTCSTQLHALWLDFVAVQGNRVPCLLRKFSSSRLHMTVLLGPPAALTPAPCPAEESWHQWNSKVIADSRTSLCCSSCGTPIAAAPYVTPEMMPMNAVCPMCESQTYGNLLPYTH